jgi:hypothetical protein
MGPAARTTTTGDPEKVPQTMVRGQAARKVTCEECYFRANGLCAVSGNQPCPTFRPDRPGGLRPPAQLRFDFRQRTQSAWAFPSAQEQAALHN